MGNLNRVQKRNLAIVLTSQAREAVSDWTNISKQEFDGVTPGVLEEISAEEAKLCFGSWLRYLPNKPARDMLPAEETAASAESEPVVAAEPDAEPVAEGTHDDTATVTETPLVTEDGTTAENTTPEFTF